MTFAENTSVPVERSRAELESLLSKAGAMQRQVGSDDAKGEAWIIFRLAERNVRLDVPLPKRDLAEFTQKPNGRGGFVPRKPADSTRLWEQACRARWRAVVLLTKAKLEAIAIGQTTFEREFLADIYLPNGRTVHQAIEAELKRSYVDGKMPALLGPAPYALEGK